MKFEPTDDHAMLVETFARFQDTERCMAHVCAAQPSGFDAALLMEEAGRTIASGPTAEAIAVARALAA